MKVGRWCVQMLNDLRVVSARVMSNEPHRCSLLEASGVSVTEYVPAWRPPSPQG